MHPRIGQCSGWIVVALLVAVPCWGKDGPAFEEALRNGRLANEGFGRCVRFVDGWLAQADPVTGLIPRNLSNSKDLWNAQDAAADNYPFMVLTCALCDRERFGGRMRDMLDTETRLTSRIDSLPDTYSFGKQGFASEKPDLNAILFGTSEYIKDGLMPLTEWLGPSPWSRRMLTMLDDMWKHAPVTTPYGPIVSTNVEVNGEMLQVLSRVYWMTGQHKYLDWAVRLGDYYLLGGHHPTRDLERLRLRDHGCEIVSGLCELYATVHFARPEKKALYKKPIHDMLDRILEVGRKEDGMLYNWVEPGTGRHDERIADTWGYTYNAYYTVYLLDGTEAYRQAVLTALRGVTAYVDYAWEGSSADGHADAIEGALNLYNREPIEETARWIDGDNAIHVGAKKPDGIIEGWHGDGNFARTTLMYCLWKTQGLTIRPWRQDVAFGAMRQGNTLYVVLSAEEPWDGRLLFDTPRHKTVLGLPMDWPRINQFPEWFTVEAEASYIWQPGTGPRAVHKGQAMAEGIHVELAAGQTIRLTVSREPES